MCVQFEGDSPLVEEFELPLCLAAGCDFGVAQRWRRRRSSRRLLSLPLPVCGGVVFCWVCLFACVVCVVVVYASARYVRMLLLFI